MAKIFDKLPNWIKLDNAATIYPSTLSKTFAAMFRMTVTLNDKVNKKTLDMALKNIIKRFPSFRYKLKSGLFWCYFKYNRKNPVIGDDYNNPMLRINFKNNNDYMFRIRYFDKRIAIEVFHALTDGTGAITFLLTLVGEYLKLKEHIKIEYNKYVLNPKQKPLEDEYNDAFYKFARGIGALEKETKAYHMKGNNIANYKIDLITGIIPVSKLKEVAKSYDCTITEFITSLLVLTIQDIYEQDHRCKKSPIKVSVPVNLRNIYPTNTFRNFSSYVNVGIDAKYGHYTLEEIINEVKYQLKLLVNEKRLNSKISGNTNMSKKFFIRIVPMFVKKHILSIADKIMGDSYISSTFSNLGLITIPKSMEKYVNEMGFIIGRSRGKSNACGCIGYKDNLYLTFSSTIHEKEYERLFFKKLIDFNIPVEIESNIGGK